MLVFRLSVLIPQLLINLREKVNFQILALRSVKSVKKNIFKDTKVFFFICQLFIHINFYIQVFVSFFIHKCKIFLYEGNCNSDILMRKKNDTASEMFNLGILGYFDYFSNFNKNIFCYLFNVNGLFKLILNKCFLIIY